MKGYYTRTFVGVAVVFVVLAGAAVLANAIASEAKVRYSRLLDADKAGTRLRAAHQEKAHRPSSPSTRPADHVLLQRQQP